MEWEIFYLHSDESIIVPLFFTCFGILLDRAYGRVKERKRQYTEDVCRPMLEEIRSVVEGYESVKNIDSESYPYQNDEFHSVWNTPVRELKITDSQKKTVPPDVREKLDCYGEKIDEVQAKEAEKRDNAGEIPAPGSKYYKVLCYSAPILLTAEQEHRFSREVLLYAEGCEYPRAREVVEDWEDDDEFPEPYWSELNATIGEREPTTEVNVRGRTKLFWDAFERQHEEYRSLQKCAAALEETLSKEKSRDLVSYVFERYVAR